MNPAAMILLILIEFAALGVALLGTWLITGDPLAVGEVLPLWIGMFAAAGVGTAAIIFLNLPRRRR